MDKPSWDVVCERKTLKAAMNKKFKLERLKYRVRIQGTLNAGMVT